MAGGISAPVEPTKGVLRMPKPPEGSKLIGQTRHGQNLYEREITEMVRDENGQIMQESVLGPDGEPLWIKHPTTGVPIRPRMRNVTRRRTQRFVIHVEVNERGVATGQHTILEWTDEMERDVERHERMRRSDTYRDELFSKAAERGITPDELLDRLLGGDEDAREASVEAAKAAEAAGDVPEPEAEPDVSEPEPDNPDTDSDVIMHKGVPIESFPYHKGGGTWILSDGSEVTGAKKEEAEAAEADLHQTEEPVEL